MPRRVRVAAVPAASPPRGQVELLVDGQLHRRVVLEGILKARASLAIATADFKATLLPDGPRVRRGTARSIIHVLSDLARRGVEVRLLHAGVPSAPALRTLRGGLPANLRIRRCPRLHAKAVIVDCQAMYLGSANLTGAGLGAKSEYRRNFEWGFWTASTDLIDAVLAQFDALWEGRRCPSCGRKDVCPVPLEEPRLA